MIQLKLIKSAITIPVKKNNNDSTTFWFSTVHKKHALSYYIQFLLDIYLPRTELIMNIDVENTV